MLWLVAAVVLPNLVATVIFLIEPQLFYFRAWEYMSDVVYRTKDSGLEWHGPEAGDLSRTSLLSAQETWTTNVSVDELGFRSVPRRAEEYPIAVAGDSMIFGSGLSDEETLPWVLSDLLETPVFNGGRTSFANLLKHPSLGRLVLVLDMRGEESLRDHFTPLEWDTPFEPLRTPEGSLLGSVPPERFLPAPAVLRLGSRLLRDVAGRATGGDRDPGWRFSRIRHDPRHLAEIVDGAVARAEEVRARGIQYVFIAMPKKQTIYGRAHGLEIDDYTLGFTATLAEALQARGVPSVDLAPALRRRRDEQVYFRTDTHWTGLGVRIAAEEIVKQLDLKTLVVARRDP